MSYIEQLGQINDISSITNTLGLTPLDMVNLWKNLLKELKEGNVSIYSTGEDSILAYIKEYCNLPDDENLGGGAIYQGIYEDPDNSDFWNESVIDAIDYFKTQVETYNPQEYIYGSYNIEMLKRYSDAGATFNGPLQNTHWVEPFTNLNNYTYNAVRNADEIDQNIYALNNNSYLNFTRTQEHRADKWLRLIMPTNVHHVEVEDLDRNFWVISIILSVISAYIFDESSPLINMLEKIMDEITQLWENIGFLWTTLAALTQKKGQKIHVEVMPMPNDYFNNYRKFDDFDAPIATIDFYNGNTWKEVADRFDYLRYKYPNQDLVVLPIIRAFNYQRDWYKAEYYPYILFFTTNDNSWHRANIKYNRTLPLIFDMTNSLYEDGPVFGNFMAGARENIINYSYFYPLTNIYNQIDYGKRYYGLARIVPEIEVEPYNTGFKITKLQWHIYDASVVMKEQNVEAGLMKTIGIKQPVIIEVNKDNYGQENPNVVPIPLDTEESTAHWSPTVSSDIETIATNDYKYYMGELVSYYRTTRNPQFVKGNFKIVKIGDFLPNNNDFYSGLDSTDSIHTILDYITDDNQTAGYDTQTYGVGAMKFKDSYFTNNRTHMQSYFAPHLCFLNYCWIDTFKDSRARNINDSWHWGEGYHVTPDILTQLSKRRILNLVAMGQLDNEPGLYATKIGISYWTGDNGMQWSSGLVSNLIYYDGEGHAENIGFVGLMDGYWTDNTNVFTVVNGSRWRRLELYADVDVDKDDETNEVSFWMKQGKIVWYDHNKEVYSHIVEDEFNRPRADMNLDTSDQTHVLTFSNPDSPYSNKRLYPYIVPPVDNHIFKDNKPKLLVDVKDGVLNWVVNSYDPNEINLRLGNANRGGYITTLRPV